MKPHVYKDLDIAQRRAVRLAYIEHQGGKCLHCSSPLDADPPKSITGKTINWRRFPPNFLRYPVHLHHDHKTGLTLGAVHAYCNAVLWQYHGE